MRQVLAGTRPPKNGIKVRLSRCGRPEVKIISAPASSVPAIGVFSKFATRLAMAGAGSIQATGQGASFKNRSISNG